MEFAVELRREAGGKDEVKAWVLGGSVEGKSPRRTSTRCS
jgi:hypothetical protein